MKIIIFRHGETDWNRDKKLQGHCNIPLNDNGISQANELARNAKEFNLDIIYSSDLSRAKLTAEILAKQYQLNIVLEARLREKSFGKAEGMSMGQIEEVFGNGYWEQFRDSSEESWNFRFDGGESRKECLKRTLDVFSEIKTLNKYKRVGISTHGGVIRTLMLDRNILNPANVKVGNCHHFEIDFTDREKYSFLHIS